jgi:hypothetical protein
VRRALHAIDLTPLPRARRPPLWGTALAVAILTALQMVRRPSDPPVWDSLYVEDGQVFLAQAIDQHVWDTLATSHLGYLHTGARTITEIATWFPLEHAPLVMSLLTSLTVALLAAYVFEASGAWIASPLLRGVLAIAVVLVPVTARDIAGTVANLHWYLIYASFWAVVNPWRSRGWLAVSALLVLASTLTDPLTAVLLPLALLPLARARHDRTTWVVPGAIALGLLVQLVLRDEGAERVGGVDAGAIPRIFAERVTSSLLAGDRHLFDLFDGRTGSPFAWGSLILVAGLIAFAAWRLGGGRRRNLVIAATGLALTYFLIPVLSRGTELLVPDEPWALGASRYFYLPVMFLITALVAAADRAEPDPDSDRVPRRHSPWREIALALLVLVPVALDYRAPHRTEGEPRWGPGLEQAERACAARRPVGAVTLTGDPADPTAIIPTHRLGHWYVPIDCSDLG